MSNTAMEQSAVDSVCPVGVSFGFSRTIAKKTLDPSVISESEKTVEDKESISDTQSLKQTKSEKLVIPIKPGKWKLERQSNNVSKTGDKVTDEAVKEIISEACGLGIDKSELSIGCVTQDKDGRERGSQLKRGQIHDAERDIQDDDYEKVPVQQFGMAMLRGMGWKDEDESGSKPYEVRPRPVGLGLGASVPIHSAAYGVKKDTSGNKEEKLTLKPGVCCQVLKGKLEGQYGIVTGIEEDAMRVFVTMALGGETVSFSQYAIQIVTKAEYDREHRCINKKSVEKYNQDNSQYKKDKATARRQKDSDDHRRRHDESDRRTNGSDSSKNRKNKLHDDLDDRSPKRAKHASSPIWVHPCLRVRFVDEKYKHGKYFKTKVVVIDVVSRDSCICRTDGGQLIEGVRQDQLETVIPHDQSSSVMIVAGSHKSQLGEIVKRDKKLCRAVIQLLPDRDQVVTLDYDSICEYIGETD